MSVNYNILNKISEKTNITCIYACKRYNYIVGGNFGGGTSKKKILYHIDKLELWKQIREYIINTHSDYEITYSITCEDCIKNNYSTIDPDDNKYFYEYDDPPPLSKESIEYLYDKYIKHTDDEIMIDSHTCKCKKPSYYYEDITIYKIKRYEIGKIYEHKN